MPANRTNRDEFYAALGAHDDARLRKVLWTLYWRGTAQLRERIEDKHSRVKQYLKEGRAMRIETVINAPRDLAPGAIRPGQVDDEELRLRAAVRTPGASPGSAGGVPTTGRSRGLLSTVVRRPLCMPTPAQVAPRGNDIGNCVDDFGYRYKSWPMPLARQVHPSLDASPFGE
jgi:hypothetical protein